jgi:hypothetical protein
MGGIDLENLWWYYRRVVEHSWAKCKSVMDLMVHIYAKFECYSFPLML